MRAPHGSVLVISAGDTPGRERSYWGDVLTTVAQTRGLAGLVIDGGVRDMDEIIQAGFPVFCQGATMMGPGKSPGGSLGAPIRIGDVAISSGDLIVGDCDGVVAVPAGQVEAVFAAAEKRTRFEYDAMRRIRAGESTFAIFGWDEP